MAPFFPTWTVVLLLPALPGEGEDLLRPPERLPDGIPRLAPLLAGENGAAITTRAAWEARRADIEGRWRRYLGELPREKAPLRAEVIGVEELPAFTRKHVRYQVEESVFTDGYLLLPRRGAAGPAGGKGSLPAVVVFHSTVNSQAKEPAGLEPARPELMIGVHLAEKGFAVLCPRCYIFEERAGYAENVEKEKARHPSWKGMTRMILDAVRAVDYLESLPEVDSRRIGCMGHSLGAKEALHAAAFDTRYRAAVFSEGGIGTTYSNWDAVWYLGDAIRAPETGLEHHQLLGLIAPRAFLLLAGDSADGPRSWPFIEAALPVYKLLGAKDAIGWLDHGEGHRYPPRAREAAEAFLERWLR